MEIRRKVKNVVYKYSEPERLVREATSNDPWGPTTTIMNEIADLTHCMESFEEIMQIIWKRLNDKGKNWRHVYKCLLLLDYLIKCGDEHVAIACKNNIHSIDTLKDFQYFEEHKDLGLGVRERSKALVTLLRDEEILVEERERGQKVKEKFQGSANALGSHQQRRPGDLGREIKKQGVRFPKTVMKLNFDENKHSDEDEDLQMAIALSKEEHEKSLKKKEEDDKIEEMKIKIALEQSKREEEALSVLRLPPKVSTTLAPVGLLDVSSGDTTQGRTVLNGFGDSTSKIDHCDPWGSSLSEPSVSLDFDPWKGASVADNGKIWPGAKNVQTTSILDDIFGEEKPSLHFEADWGTDIRTASLLTTERKEDPMLNSLWPVESSAIGLSKNISGSMSSFADVMGANHEQVSVDTRTMQHSSSAANLVTQNKTKMTPQDFLGANASLINFENLLPTPKAAPKNPFGLSSGTTGNPFNSVTVPAKTPMNQMAQGSLQPHGASVNYGALAQLPPPILPSSQGLSLAYDGGAASPWAPQAPWAAQARPAPLNPFMN